MSFLHRLLFKSAAAGIRSTVGSKDSKQEDDEEFVMGILDEHGELGGHEVSHQVVQQMLSVQLQLMKQLEQEDEGTRKEMDNFSS